MFLSGGFLSSNMSNMNIINILFFSLCLFACACDNASYNCFYVCAMFFTCVQVYNIPHADSTTGNDGSKIVVWVACAGTAL